MVQPQADEIGSISLRLSGCLLDLHSAIASILIGIAVALLLFVGLKRKPQEYAWNFINDVHGPTLAVGKVGIGR